MYARDGLFIGICHQSFFSYIVTISKDADWCLLPVMYVRDGLFIGVCHQSFFSYSATISKGADWCLLPVMYARDGLFIGVCHQSFFSYSVTISKGADFYQRINHQMNTILLCSITSRIPKITNKDTPRKITLSTKHVCNIE